MKNMAFIPNSIGSWYEMDCGIFNNSINELWRNCSSKNELFKKYDTVYKLLKINSSQNIFHFWSKLIVDINKKNNIQNTQKCYIRLIDEYIQDDLEYTFKEWKAKTGYSNKKMIELYKENALYWVLYRAFKDYINSIHKNIEEMNLLMIN